MKDGARSDLKSPRTARPAVVTFDTLEPVRCPCGWARRAFADQPGAPTSLHRVRIELDARTPYHREHSVQ